MPPDQVAFFVGENMADAVDLNAPIDAVAKQRLNNQSFLAGQNAQTSDFLNRYKTAINNQESLPAMYSRIGSELGIPTLQHNAQTAQQAVYDAPQVYKQNAQGFDVNANQLSRITNDKLQYLSPIAQRAQDQYNTAVGNANTQMGIAQAQQAKELTPYNTEKDLLSERLARETTMYSQENQAELDAILQKMQAGIQISENEKARAQQLAVAEQNFQHQMELQKQSQSASQSAQGRQTQILEIGGHKKLVDTQTGQVIQDLGSSAAPAAAVKPISSYYGTGYSSSGAPYSSSVPSYFQPF